MAANKNKKGRAWRMALTALLGIAMFFACTSEGIAGGSPEGDKMLDTVDSGKYGNFEGLSAETEKRILQDYYHNNPDNLKVFTFDDFLVDNYILAYFGTYNGYIVVNIGCYDYRERVPAVMISPLKLGDWYLPQGFWAKTETWKNGQFYSLEQLYKKGELTPDDARSIASLYPGSRPIVDK